jgi:hypothetical protein
MLESYTSGTTDRQLWHKRVWIWPSSLQQSTAGESNTTYQIWSHISWLKEMNHQLKRTKLGRDQDQSFFHRNGCGQAWSHHLSARSDSSLCPDSARTQESLVPGKWPESRSPRKTRSFNSRQDNCQPLAPTCPSQHALESWYMSRCHLIATPPWEHTQMFTLIHQISSLSGGVLHKRSDSQGIRAVNTKMDHPSRKPRIPQKAGPRPRRPI